MRPTPLVTHARILIVLFGAYLAWTAVTMHPADRAAFGGDAWPLILTFGWAACLLGVLSAWQPIRWSLPWLAVAAAWCIGRAALLVVDGSASLTPRMVELRAAAGWALWMPAIAIAVAVSRTSAVVDREEEERCNG